MRLPSRTGVLGFLYLLRTSAPLPVYLGYFAAHLSKPGWREYEEQAEVFRASLGGLELSRDWFTAQIPHWLLVFDRQRLHDRDIEALEIGSWEGLASYFILKTLPRARLTCVDPWEDYSEQQGLREVERRFDSNLSTFHGRLTKVKSTSVAYFAGHGALGRFDLIYVDGSHRRDDVLADAVMGFERLKRGGLMIFDDYLGRPFEADHENPAAGINAFLKLKKGAYRILRVYYQLIIEKTV